MRRPIAIAPIWGCPVRAGIGPQSLRVLCAPIRLPRASGDRPVTVGGNAMAVEVAPCERG